MNNMKFIKCRSCGFTWDYHGKSANRTTCPHCFKTVYFPSAEVDPETYRRYALLQLKNWYDAECARVNADVVQALKSAGEVSEQALSAPANR